MNSELYLGYLRHISHEIDNVLPLLEAEADSRRSGTADRRRVIILRSHLSLIRTDITDFIKEEAVHEHN